MKDLLQEQLQEEYQANDLLRKENKQLSDDLLDYKEQHCRAIVENSEYKTRIEKLNSLRDWLVSVNKQLLTTALSSIKGKSKLHELIESTTKSIISNSLSTNQLLQKDRQEYLDTIDELHKEIQLHENQDHNVSFLSCTYTEIIH